MNELLVLPIIGFGVAAYCAYRYFKNKSYIPLGVGALVLILSIIGLIAILSDK